MTNKYGNISITDCQSNANQNLTAPYYGKDKKEQVLERMWIKGKS